MMTRDLFAVANLLAHFFCHRLAFYAMLRRFICVWALAGELKKWGTDFNEILHVDSFLNKEEPTNFYEFSAG